MNATEKSKARARAHKAGEREGTYTPAKPFNRNRFLLQLATVAAVVVAVLVGLSIFFKVGAETNGDKAVPKVKVSGAVKYDPYDIVQASGISEKDNLITLNKNRIGARILAEFPYIESVQVEKQLPDTVVIQVTEMEVVYAVQDQENNWWLMSAGGKLVENCPEAIAKSHTKITGFQLASPEAGKQAVAYEAPQEPDAEGNTVPVTVYAREKLETALAVLQNLETEGFVGTMASVDVSDLMDIRMWYGNRFEMLVGDSQNLPKKINALAQALDLKEDYETGVLDASFTIWPDQVGHSQFS